MEGQDRTVNSTHTVRTSAVSRKFFWVPAKRHKIVIINAMNVVTVGKKGLKSRILAGLADDSVARNKKRLVLSRWMACKAGRSVPFRKREDLIHVWIRDPQAAMGLSDLSFCQAIEIFDLGNSPCSLYYL